MPISSKRHCIGIVEDDTILNNTKSKYSTVYALCQCHESGRCTVVVWFECRAILFILILYFYYNSPYFYGLASYNSGTFMKSAKRLLSLCVHLYIIIHTAAKTFFFSFVFQIYWYRYHSSALQWLKGICRGV